MNRLLCSSQALLFDVLFLVDSVILTNHSPLWQIHISDLSLAARATHLTAELQEYLEGQKSEMTLLAVSLQ